MAHGTAIIPKSSGGSSHGRPPKTYEDNADNRSAGRVGMAHGTAVTSKSSGGSNYSYGRPSKTYEDNSYNRSVGRVGMEHGTAVMSKSSGGSSYGRPSKTYVDNPYNRSARRVGMEHGTAVISKSSGGSSYGGSSYGESTKTYVDYMYYRSTEVVEVAQGTVVTSKSSGESSYGKSAETYEDNSYNKSAGRSGGGGTSYFGSSSGGSPSCGGSRSYGGSSYGESTKTYVDNAYNSNAGRVEMAHGKTVVYKDNAFNRHVGRVGLPIGNSVMSRSSRNGSSGSTGEKVYKDNAFNQRVGRAGLPLGSMIISRSKTTSTQSRKAKNTCWKTKPTKMSRDILEQYYDNPDNDMDLLKWHVDGEDPSYIDEASEHAVDLINRLEQIRLWQEESRTDRQPTTSRDLLKTYPGKRIQYDELQLKKRIGHGGFGEVYFAKWKGTIVAVKKLRVQRVSKKRLQEFTSEINIFCTLDHPNIVKFIGACCVTPNIAIVMEYMEGSLYEKLHIADDTLSEEEKLDIIIQIARGLEYLHKKHIAHCDVKSQNVLLNKNKKRYEAKITDFGLSMMKSNSDTPSARQAETVADSMLAELAGMGFELKRCQAAVNSSKLTVQEAADWLLKDGDKEEAVPSRSTLASMGFGPERCQAAVNSGKLTVRDAVDWLLEDGDKEDVPSRSTQNLTTQDTSQVRRNLGTPRYSAPEVLRGELLGRTSMMKADVYSLGLVVYEVISENEPFNDLNAKQLKCYVGNGVKIPTFRNDVNPFVVKDIRECWTWDPSNRPSASNLCFSVEIWEYLYVS